MTSQLSGANTGWEEQGLISPFTLCLVKWFVHCCDKHPREETPREEALFWLLVVLILLILGLQWEGIMLMGVCGTDYQPREGLESEARMGGMHDTPSTFPRRWLSAARPYFPKFWHLPEQPHQLGTYPSVQKPSEGTLHTQAITFLCTFLKFFHNRIWMMASLYSGQADSLIAILFCESDWDMSSHRESLPSDEVSTEASEAVCRCLRAGDRHPNRRCICDQGKERHPEPWHILSPMPSTQILQIHF